MLQYFIFLLFFIIYLILLKFDILLQIETIFIRLGRPCFTSYCLREILSHKLISSLLVYIVHLTSNILIQVNRFDLLGIFLLSRLLINRSRPHHLRSIQSLAKVLQSLLFHLFKVPNQIMMVPTRSLSFLFFLY